MPSAAPPRRPAKKPRQLLHLVFGGELDLLEAMTFRDLSISISSASIPIMPVRRRPGRPRLKPVSTMPTCATSLSTSTGCWIRAAKRDRLMPIDAQEDCPFPDRSGSAWFRGRRVFAVRPRDNSFHPGTPGYCRDVRAGMAANSRNVAWPALDGPLWHASRAPGECFDFSPWRCRN